MKEKKLTLHKCHQCTTRKCPLCGQKVDSIKLLNHHVREAHDNYKFLCKFCKCQSSYSFRNSAERHVRHHLLPRFMCDSCGKQFHEKYVFEAHKNVHSNKSYACTYPNCDRVYKFAAEYQRHLKKHREPWESSTCSECDKSFEEKNI